MNTYAQHCPAGIDPRHPTPSHEEVAWTEDGTCRRCGSLNPDTFMARIEAGTAKVEPTGRRHKAYIHALDGELFRQTHKGSTRYVDGATFYFQHLSVDQRARFVELLRDKRIKFGYPGYFYVAPLFLPVGSRL